MNALLKDESAISWRLNGNLSVGPFEFHEKGMSCTSHPSFVDWTRCMSILKDVEQKIIRPYSFWIGDMLAYGEANYGETYSQAIEATGLSYGSLATAKWVCSNIPPAERRPELSFSHHSEVCALPPKKRAKYLKMAIQEEMSTMHLRNRIAKDERGEEPPTLTCPECGASFHVNRKVEIVDKELK